LHCCSIMIDAYLDPEWMSGTLLHSNHKSVSDDVSIELNKVCNADLVRRCRPPMTMFALSTISVHLSVILNHTFSSQLSLPSHSVPAPPIRSSRFWGSINLVICMYVQRSACEAWNAHPSCWGSVPFRPKFYGNGVIPCQNIDTVR